MERTIRTGLAACLVLLTSVPASADVKSGVDAWTRGDFAAAVAEWQVPAEQGDADAQFNLGQAYKLGRGVNQDLARAEELFGKAAVQDHIQASDNYGLMLFQRGERAKALPFISSAADRGEPRAQYLLGLAHFNGDHVAKDWVRAYALVSLAHQSGLTQAAGALSQMDQYIPLEQRQQSAAVAQELAAQAQATRARQLAAVDLGSSIPNTPAAPVVTATPRPPAIAAARPAPSNSTPSIGQGPRYAGADFTQPRPPAPAATQRPPAKTPPAASAPAAVRIAAAASRPAAAAPARASAPTAPAPAGGVWRVQLGAFGVASNAEAMWNRVRSRPEIAGRRKLLIPSGAVTKLQAGDYASEEAARSACTRLAATGIACLAVRN